MGGESLESDRALTEAPPASAAATDEEKVPPAHVAVRCSVVGFTALSWAVSGQMRHGGGLGGGLCYQPTLIFMSALFRLNGAESSISTRLKQVFKTKVDRTQLQKTHSV